MIGELHLFGLFAPMSLLTAIGAGLLIAAARWIMARAGFYRLVWHPGLFDLALFVIFWSGLSLLADATKLALPS